MEAQVSLVTSPRKWQSGSPFLPRSLLPFPPICQYFFPFFLGFGPFMSNSQERGGISPSLYLQQTPTPTCVPTHSLVSLDEKSSLAHRWQWRVLEVPRHLSLVVPSDLHTLGCSHVSMLGQDGAGGGITCSCTWPSPGRV